MLVNEGRTVEDDVDGSIVARVEGTGIGSDMLGALTNDAPAAKRLFSWLYASSGLKVDVTVGRVAVSEDPRVIVTVTPVGVAIGGEVESVGFMIGSGMVEFKGSVEMTPPFPPAPSIIERALDSEVHATN